MLRYIGPHEKSRQKAAIAYLLEQSDFAMYATYVDPILLIILGFAILSIPLKIMLNSLNEVVNKAPPEAISAVVEKKLKQTLSAMPYEHVEVRISKETWSAMREWNPSILMDILFICDPDLAD